MVKERLELDLSAALSALSNIDSQLGSAASRFSDALGRALSQLDATATITADTSQVPGEVEGAVDAADTGVEVTGDAKDVTGAIDGAVDAADDHIEVTGEAAQVTGAIDSAVDAANTRVEVTADLGDAPEKAAALGEGLSTAGVAAGGLGIGIERAKGAMGALGVVASGAALAAVFTDAIGAASDLNESTNKVKVVFGELSGPILTFGRDAAQAVGLSNQAALEAVGTFGNLFTALGTSKRAARDMSIDTVTLAADLASFNNIGVDEALERLRSGLVGEVEPLRRMGISFNAATVEAKAMELGLADASGEISEGAKVQARYALILEQSGAAQGDFARTSDDLANKQRIVRAEFQNAAAQVGRALLPAVLGLLTGIEDLLPSLVSVAQALGSVLGPALTVAGGAVKVLAVPLAGVAAVLDALSSPIGLAAVGIVALGVALANLPAILALVAAGWRALTVAIASNPIGAAAVAIVSIIGVMKTFGSTAASVTIDVQKLGRATDREIRDMVDALLVLRETGFMGFDEAIRPMRLVKETAEESVGAARRLGEAFVAAGAITKDQLVGALGEAEDAAARAAATMDDGKAATDEYRAAVESLGSTFEAKLPTAAGAVGEFVAAVRAFFDDDALIPSVTAYVTHLQDVVRQTGDFTRGIGGLVEQGLTGLAGIVQSAGVEVGSAWLDEIARMPPETRDELNRIVTYGGGELVKLQALAAQYGVATATAMLSGLAPITPGAQAIIDETNRRFAESDTPGAAGRAGVAATSAFGVGVSGVPSAAGAAVAQAAGAISAAGRGLNNPAYVEGAYVGAQFGEGVAGGILSRIGMVAQASRALLTAAVEAARRAGLIASPSRLFAREVGRPIGEGIALGIEDSAANVVARAEAIVRDAAASASFHANVSGSIASSSSGTDTLGQIAGLLAASQTAPTAAPITNYVSGVTDPAEAARLITREQRFNERYAGVR